MFAVSEKEALKLITQQPWLTGVHTTYADGRQGFVRIEWGGNIVDTGPLSKEEAEKVAKDMQEKWDYNVLTRDPLDTVEELQEFFSTQKNELDEQIRIQSDILAGFTHLLTSHGIQTWNSTGVWRLTNVDRPTKRWTWSLTNPAVAAQEADMTTVSFERPFYRNMVMNFQPAIVRNRKNESAALFQINNQADTPIQRVISKEVQTISNVRNNVTIGINWNISAGIQAGVSGTDSNFGTTVLASFGMSLGGDFKTEKETSKTNQNTQKVEETLTFSPNSFYEVELTANKVSYTREYYCSGVADWELVTLSTSNSKPNDLTPSIARGAKESEKDGWLEMMAKICGTRNIQNNFYLETPRIRQERTVDKNFFVKKDVALKALEDSSRVLEFKGSIDYDEASELSLLVVKKEKSVVSRETS